MSEEIPRSKDHSLRSDIFREPFPNEYANEYAPEELDALLLHEDLLASVQRIEELHRRKKIWKYYIGGVDEERTHDT